MLTEKDMLCGSWESFAARVLAGLSSRDLQQLKGIFYAGALASHVALMKMGTHEIDEHEAAERIAEMHQHIVDILEEFLND